MPKLKYEYRLVPIALMQECALVPLEKDAYISESLEAKTVLGLLEAGFRWIRTEDTLAVLERETHA